MSYQKLSKTLQLLISSTNKAVSVVAKEAGIPQQTLQRIVSGNCRKPHLSSLNLLATYFQVSIEQLNGEQKIQGLNYNPKREIMIGWQEIPIIEWEGIEEWVKKEHNIRLINNVTLTDALVSEDSFALIMNDSSMEPIYSQGTLLIIDPHKEIKDRCYVIAKISNQKNPILRLLIIDGDHCYLKPSSPDLANFKMEKMQVSDKILGFLVQAKKNLI